MKPEDITTLFAAADEAFPAIVGQPEDSHIHALVELLTPLLLEIPYDSETGVHNLVGLIQTEADYTDEYSTAFVRPGRMAAYDASIPSDANNLVRAKAEAQWTARLKDTATYDATERSLRKFVISKVEDTWIRELKDGKFFYTRRTAKEIIDHLQAGCLGTHAIDALSLQIAMQDYHHKAEGIPEYINMLEDAQRAAMRIDANNPITNASVLVIATSAFLKDNQFPRTSEDWEDLPPNQKTWEMWKKMYKTAQGRERVRVKAAGGANAFGGNNEGGANAASAAGDKRDNSDETAVSIGDLEACFDNLANAAKVERTTLDELVKNASVLTTTNSELVAENKKLRAENDTLKKAAKGNSGNRERKLCGHCKGKCKGLKKEHKHQDCLELPANAGKRGTDWKSCL